MKKLVGDFREVSGNGIIVDRDGNTLCAVFSGRFGVPPSTCQAIMDDLAAWRDDPTARIPPPTVRKRSYDQRNAVSLPELKYFFHFVVQKLILFVQAGGCRPLWLVGAGRRQHRAGGAGRPPALFGTEELGPRERQDWPF